MEEATVESQSGPSDAESKFMGFPQPKAHHKVSLLYNIGSACGVHLPSSPVTTHEHKYPIDSSVSIVGQIVCEIWLAKLLYHIDLINTCP